MPKDTFQQIVEELFRDTGASRVTLRLDAPKERFVVIAEAIQPGLTSLKGREMSPAALDAETFRFLATTQEILVQKDCLRADYPPPPELIALNVRAQMLAPIMFANELVGIIAIHHNATSRDWSDQDIASLRAAVARAQRAIQDLN